MNQTTTLKSRLTSLLVCGMFFLGLCPHLEAQSQGLDLANRYPLERPSYYDSEPLMRNLSPYRGTVETQRRRNKVKWSVYGTIQGGDTFWGPNRSTGKTDKKLNFLERYWVGEATEDFVRLIKYEGLDEDEGRFRADVNRYDMGWVSKNDVLLTESPIYSNTSQIAVKAITSVRPEWYQDFLNSGINNLNQLVVYNSPACQPSQVIPLDLRLVQLLFIYKIHPVTQAALIGNRIDFDPDDPGNSVLGWIPKGLYSPWMGRNTLEPNIDDEAISEQDTLGVTPSVFFSLDGVNKFLNTRVEDLSTSPIMKNKKRYIFFESTFKNPPPSQWIRPFVLGNDRTNLHFNGLDTIRKVVFSSPLLDEDNNPIIPNDSLSKLIKESLRQIKLKSNYNIVFVVDGTISAEFYHEKVVEVLEGLDVEGLGVEKRVNIGAVLYGHTTRSRYCTSKIGVIDDFELQALGASSLNSFRRWLLTENRSEPTECNSLSAPEAVFDGLEAALDLIGAAGEDSKMMTNILVLLGDAGDQPNQQDRKDTLSNRLAEYHSHIIATQLTNKVGSYTSLYTRFRLNILDLIESSNEILVRSPAYKRLFSNQKSGIPAVELSEDPTARNVYSLNTNAPTLGTFIYTSSSDDSKFDPNLFQAELQNLLNNVISRNNMAIKEAIQAITKGKFGENWVNIVSLLADVLYQGFDPSNIQLLVETYVPMSHVNQGDMDHPLFRYGVLLKETEFDRLNNMFRQLSERPWRDPSELDFIFKEGLKIGMGSEETASQDGISNRERLEILEARWSDMPALASFFRELKGFYRRGEIRMEADTLVAYESRCSRISKNLLRIKRLDQYYKYDSAPSVEATGDELKKDDFFYWVPLSVFD